MVERCEIAIVAWSECTATRSNDIVSIGAEQEGIHPGPGRPGKREQDNNTSIWEKPSEKSRVRHGQNNAVAPFELRTSPAIHLPSDIPEQMHFRLTTLAMCRILPGRGNALRKRFTFRNDMESSR
jgi:hypothetical protein